MHMCQFSHVLMNTISCKVIALHCRVMQDPVQQGCQFGMAETSYRVSLATSKDGVERLRRDTPEKGNSRTTCMRNNTPYTSTVASDKVITAKEVKAATCPYRRPIKK